ncbi:MAG: efflux transporter outer membrane subunit [Betaproteobacteria bacterium]|nr:efflux transporter outer membrane subunit [Betaproteobacteria bacterium]
MGVGGKTIRKVSGTSGLVGVGALVLVGCTTVGPDFTVPTLDSKAAVLSSPAELPAQHFDGRRRQYWWQSYGCENLNRMVQLALDQNPTVDAARASLIQAAQTANALRDSLTLPTADAQLAQTRQRLSTAEFGLPGGQAYTFSLTNAAVNVSYPLDVFGGNRRRIETQEAQREVQAHLWQAARETLAANVVTTVVREAMLRAQIKATDDLVMAQREALELARQRQALGALSLNELSQPETELAQSLASRNVLEQQLDQVRHQLAAYMGQYPNQSALPQFTLTDLHLPEHVPTVVPSELVHQRPDIRASEAQWHAATANLGVTISGAYPDITLNGSMGALALTPGALFSPASEVWSLGAGVVQPLFHGGALKAAERGARAAVDAAAAQYRQTVVDAFRSVADVLGALNHDADTLTTDQQAERSQQLTLNLTQQQYQWGGVSYPVVLSARQQEAQQQLALAGATGARLADTAALYLALGAEDPFPQ